MIKLKQSLDPVIASDAYCFMWVVCPQIKEGIALLEGWGFKYATVAFQWTKLYPKAQKPFHGPGRYTPSNMEMVIVGARGRLWHPNTGWKPGQEVRVPHPRNEAGKIIHSRKPSQIASNLLQWLGPHIGDGNGFLELFATQETPGWTCLGHAISGNYLDQDLTTLLKEKTIENASLYTNNGEKALLQD